MSQNIEIEFKNMLSPNEYRCLLDFFEIPRDAIVVQVNHYFDTAGFALKNIQSALRIREKQNHFEMTLKQPAEIGLLETNQTLTSEEANEAILSGKLPDGAIRQVLEKKNIRFSDLEYFGTLITKRAEKKVHNGLIVLDHSQYLNNEDYELEYEAEDFAEGQQAFLRLLKTHGIPSRTTKNKIERFYRQKYRQKG